MTSSKRTVWDCGDLIFHGRYEVLHVIRGSMGIVYVVKDLEYSEELSQTGRPQILAAKTLHPELADLPAVKRRFIEEAKIWIRMHPQDHVVRAQFSDHFLGVPYIFADYIAPGLFPNSLAEWIRHRITPCPVALYFAMQILDGLWFAYEDGVAFHGDLKPANVLIDRACSVKITDWGLSRPASEGSAAARVLSSRPNPDLDLEDGLRHRGTPGYAAPELARGAEPTRAIDIFSLGVVLGEMLTGHLLPAGCSAGEAESALGQVFPWRGGEAATLAGALADFLAPDPEERIARYDPALERLTELLTSVTGLRLLPPYLQIRPTDPRRLGQTAFSLMNLGETAESYALFRQLLRLEKKEGKPEEPMVLFNLDHGELVAPPELLEKLASDPGEELRLARQLAEQAPGAVETWIKYAELCAAQGLHEEALNACERAETAGLLAADLLVLKGHLLRLLGRSEEALSAFERAIGLEDANGTAWYNRGETLRSLGRRSESRECFRKAIERDGPKGPAYNHLGTLLLEEGRLAEAAAEFQEASRHAPDNPKVWFNLGQTVRALGSSRDALRYYDIALSIDPRYERARQARSETLEEL